MKEKILAVLKRISLQEFGIKEKTLGDEDIIQGIVIKPGNIGFAINIGDLGIDHKEGEKLKELCEEKIRETIDIDRITIVLTSHESAGNKSSHAKARKVSNIASVPGVKKIIAIASAKGGVGKSTLACNLAISLQKTGCRTALLDADIYGPSIPHLMNIKEKPDIKDDLLIPLISHDVKCFSIGSLIDENAAGIWRGPMITKILHQLIHGVNWQFDGNQVDTMIIDMPPGTGDIYLSLAEKFPLAGVVIVSTPQALSVIDVVKSIDCFKKLNIPILGLIQNMSYLEVEGNKHYLFGKDGAKDLAEKLDINFLGDIPIVHDSANACDHDGVDTHQLRSYLQKVTDILGAD